jgi:hypothetical protein
MVRNVKTAARKRAPTPARGPSPALAVAVVLASSAGVGYAASHIWPLPGLSAAATQDTMRAPSLSAQSPAPSVPAAVAPAAGLAAPRVEPGSAISPQSASPRADAASNAASRPPAAAAESEGTAAPTPEPLPALALLPLSPATTSEPPRAAPQAATGAEEARKPDMHPAITAPASAKAAPTNAINRPPARQRAAQPATLSSAPPPLQDKALRDFMSYPADGY